MAPRKSQKHSTAFAEKLYTKFGLKITSRDAALLCVTCMVCLFSITCERDAKVGDKRKRTDMPEYWQKGLFRTDNYASHIRTRMDAAYEEVGRISEYQKFETTEARTRFFTPAELPLINTLHSHCFDRCTTQRFLFKPIIETVI